MSLIHPFLLIASLLVYAIYVTYSIWISFDGVKQLNFSLEIGSVVISGRSFLLWLSIILGFIPVIHNFLSDTNAGKG